MSGKDKDIRRLLAVDLPEVIQSVNRIPIPRHPVYDSVDGLSKMARPGSVPPPVDINKMRAKPGTLGSLAPPKSK